MLFYVSAVTALYHLNGRINNTSRIMVRVKLPKQWYFRCLRLVGTCSPRSICPGFGERLLTSFLFDLVLLHVLPQCTALPLPCPQRAGCLWPHLVRCRQHVALWGRRGDVSHAVEQRLERLLIAYPTLQMSTPQPLPPVHPLCGHGFHQLRATLSALRRRDRHAPCPVLLSTLSHPHPSKDTRPHAWKRRYTVNDQ